MEQIKGFIDGSIDSHGCNLKCDYCYLEQGGYQYDHKKHTLTYPLETVLKACSRERLGGIYEIKLVGNGETLLPDDSVDLICGLIEEGHYVMVVTNGTMFERMREIVERLKQKKLTSHLVFALSLHYNELKRLKLLEKFRQTILFLKEEEISFLLSLTLAPSYFPVVDEIIAYCTEMDVWPSVSIALDSDKDKSILLEGGSEAEYFKVAERFQSEPFRKKKNRYGKKVQSFCYAGKWSFSLNFSTGIRTQCLFWNDSVRYNFYENLGEPVIAEPVGYRCKAPHCVCGYKDSYHLIPEEEYQGRDGEADPRVEKWINRTYCTDLAKTCELLSEEEKRASEERCLAQDIFHKKCEMIDVSYRDGQYETVINASEELLGEDLEPRDFWTAAMLVKYGYALLNTGGDSIEKALDLQSCYDEMQYCGDYCTLMGLIYMRNGMIDEAVAAFQDARETYYVMDEGANTYLPCYNLGVIYECTGSVEQGKDYYEQCGSYAPAKERLKEMLGKGK